jgi:hypothetical protein
MNISRNHLFTCFVLCFLGLGTASAYASNWGCEQKCEYTQVVPTSLRGPAEEFHGNMNSDAQRACSQSQNDAESWCKADHGIPQSGYCETHFSKPQHSTYIVQCGHSQTAAYPVQSVGATEAEARTALEPVCRDKGGVLEGGVVCNRYGNWKESLPAGPFHLNAMFSVAKKVTSSSDTTGNSTTVSAGAFPLSLIRDADDVFVEWSGFRSKLTDNDSGCFVFESQDSPDSNADYETTRDQSISFCLLDGRRVSFGDYSNNFTGYNRKTHHRVARYETVTPQSGQNILIWQ